MLSRVLYFLQRHIADDAPAEAERLVAAPLRKKRGEDIILFRWLRVF